MSWQKRVLCWIVIGSVFLVFVTAVARTKGQSMADWRTASRASVGIAPDPELNLEAIVQVYTARAFGWRGSFGVHSWIAVKPTNADKFTVYEIIGWQLYYDGKALSVSNRPADGRWFGAVPEIIADIRGDGVDDFIKRIDVAAHTYPYPGVYQLWPGPNSNTFTAHVARAVPELRVDLPPTAIGKDYIPNGVFAPTPSGTGYQFSLFGVFGILVGREEGIEFNLLGLTFGVDFADLAIKLPLVGRVAF